MVHIRRMELTNFKSFGGTTRFPLLPGFTVVTGPNGSGKSNIIDALLFALGLSTSKGMRADRLPDLINNNCRHRYPAEAWVTVVFDLSDSDLPLDWQLLEEGAEELLAEAMPSPEQVSEQLLEPSNGAANGHKNSNGNGAAREWSVTRKLRVTKRETYTSTYYINGEACTLTELHEQLGRLRVYPEGYNVVLQGDVTNIITMNARDRRQIIDELAGVGEFDRKIATAKQKLDEVKERLERSRILEEELVKDRDRLEKDRVKAERYRVLRGEMEQKQQQEAVLKWRYAQIQEGKLREQIEAGDREGQALAQRLQQLQQEIQQEAATLETLNQQVKALGEDELLALQATLASQEAEYRQLEERFVEQETHRTQLVTQQSQLQQDMERSQQTLKQLAQQKQALEREELAALQASRDGLKRSLADIQQEEAQIRETAEAWVREQTELRRRMDDLRQQLDPLRTEEARLREQQAQLAKQIETGETRLQTLAEELEAGIQERDRLQTQRTQQEQEVNRITAAVTAAEQEVQVQQETQTRLLQEQRDKQRQLDKLEAQAQALNESQGTYATQIILTSGMTGVRGIVAQLGQVEPAYQVALETAAGGRLGFVVVDNDAIAAAGIQLLKDKRAGRATFLPLNKLQANTHLSPISAPGFVDYAANLVEFHPQYRVVFAFVFGNTAVFEDLDSARRCLGRYRIVTLQGDLLEPTGAMTGGSRSKQRGGWSFAASQSTTELEQHQIRERLEEIDRVLSRCQEALQQATAQGKQHQRSLSEAMAALQKTQLQLSQVAQQVQYATDQQAQERSRREEHQRERVAGGDRLQTLSQEIPALEAVLEQHRQSMTQLEQSPTHHLWQEVQDKRQRLETSLTEREQSLRQCEQKLRDCDDRALRLQENLQQNQQRCEEYQTQIANLGDRLSETSHRQATLRLEIGQTKVTLTQVEAKLGEIRQTRDRAEQQVQTAQQQERQVAWELEKNRENQQERREKLAALQQELATLVRELPESLGAIAGATCPLPLPLPLALPAIEGSASVDTQAPPTPELQIPEKVTQKEIIALSQEIKAIAQRLKAMEPVNMLALEEYERTQNRLQELSQKLATLEAERTEILLRIENFTTLRKRAFQEAFDAVNHNFQDIFAQLSEGDGCLELDDPEDPFQSGLNLVAHPKGKPVQRLASMSGGEKSLTALSFIFALQRYRPSPFYAFDEVDMFLDGSNAQRLAKMIEQQSDRAQFIVVSHKMPMIKAAHRTIGVTQARGAFTQVVGLNLAPKNASK